MEVAAIVRPDADHTGVEQLKNKTRDEDQDGLAATVLRARFRRRRFDECLFSTWIYFAEMKRRRIT